MLEIALKFCTPTSEMTVLFDWNLSRCSFLSEVIDLDVLLCTGLNSELVHCFFA